MASTIDEDYESLRRLRSDELSEWIGHRYPSEPGRQWWLAVVKRVAGEARRPGLDTASAAQTLTFGVSIIDVAVRLGIGPAATARCLVDLSLASLAAGVPISAVPALEIDAVAQRVLASFRLSRQDAVAAAAKRRQELLTDESAWASPSTPVGGLADPGDEISRLADVELSLVELERVMDRIGDPAVAKEVRQWIALRSQFDIGEAAAQKGHDLLAHWHRADDKESGS